MELRITATELARRLTDIVSRVRHRGETFLIESSGEPPVRMSPAGPPRQGSLGDALHSWIDKRTGVEEDDSHG